MNCLVMKIHANSELLRELMLKHIKGIINSTSDESVYIVIFVLITTI